MKARPGIPRFSGPFKSFSVTLDSNRETGTENRLLVFSQGNRAKVVEYLWLKWLWDELSKEEMLLFLTLPETLKSGIKVAGLRAALIAGKKQVRVRLSEGPLPSDFHTPTRLRYLGFKRLDVEISRFRRSLPRVPKFSGWIRSSSKKGSKRRAGGPSYLEPLAIIDNDYIDICFDWYNYLTVDDHS